MKRFVLPSLLLLAISFVLPQTAAAQTAADTFSLKTCFHFWKTGVPMSLDMFPYTPGTQGITAIEPYSAGQCVEFKFSPPSFVDGFCLSAAKNDPYASNGITAADLILIRKDLAGIQSFNNPVQFLASDANRSGSITTFDIVDLSKIILGIIPQFPANIQPWQALSNNITFNPSGGSACNYVHSPNTTSDNLEENVYKIGDVDGDANPFGPYQVPQNLPAAGISIPEVTIAAGDTVLIPVQFTPGLKMQGFQMGFSLDTAFGKILAIQTNPNSSFNAPIASPTQNDGIKTLWITDSETDDNPVFFIQIAGLQSFSVHTKLVFHQTGIPNLWVDSTDHVRPFDPNLGVTALRPEPASGVVITQPFPNPFHDRTTLQVTLNTPAAGHLRITDLSGRLVRESAVTLQAGIQQIVIDGSSLPAGMLIYYIKTDGWEVSGKLIRQP
jgi:hypothetical protein